jgi:hypothetical protein
MLGSGASFIGHWIFYPSMDFKVNLITALLMVMATRLTLPASWIFIHLLGLTLNSKKK